MYPSLSEYLYAVELAPQTLFQLQHLAPARKQNGGLYFSSGNFAVVFRMTDTHTGKYVALRCFLREAADRRERLHAIARYIAENPSNYLLPFRYYENEIWVDIRFGKEHQFDLILMPWVEGVTLSQYVASCCERQDRTKLARLARQFDEMALWLLNQPFAHGDIKPDNLLVTPEGQLVLIDYDGFFVPGLSGKGATETGTLPYRHPTRTTAWFDRHLDDFSLLAISLELHALSLSPTLRTDADSLLLAPDTISHPFTSSQWQLFRALESATVSARAGLLEFVIHQPPGQLAPLAALLTSATSTSPISRPTPTQQLTPWLSDTKWGYVDPEKQVVIPCQWESAGLFSEGLAPVRQSGKWGFCNQNGQLVIDCQFEEVRDFMGGCAMVRKQNLYGFIDWQGTYIITPQYTEIGHFVQELAWFRQGKVYGYINQQGNVIIPPQFESAANFSEGLAKVKVNGQYGFIDTTGSLQIACQYDFALNFSEELAAVEQQGKYGFINQHGELIIPYQFEMAGNFSGGLVSVKKNGKMGFINKSGATCIPFLYDDIMLPVAFPFSEGMALVRKGNLFGYLNQQGEQVIPCQFTDGNNFSEGLAAVQLAGKWGYVDLHGQLAIPCVFDHAYRFRQGLALVRRRKQLVYIDASGYIYADTDS